MGALRASFGRLCGLVGERVAHGERRGLGGVMTDLWTSSGWRGVLRG